MPVSINALTSDPTIASLKMAMEAAALRHQAIASNIANVNTPNYKRLDINSSFETEFQKAISQVHEGQTVADMPTPTIQQSSNPGMTRYDGNNVNIDQEAILLLENKSKFEFATRVLSERYNAIRAAITGKSTS